MVRRSSLAAAFVLVMLAGASGGYLVTRPSELPADATKAARTANLANGETMFNIGGCASCHATPKQEERTRLGGGLGLATPFGTFRVPNISPDPKFGLGNWTEQEFANAMLRGVGRGGEHLFPSFPYTSYQRMRIEDVRDLFAYLKTLPPVAVASLPHEVGFPFNVRRGVGAWKLLYLDGQPFTPDPGKSAAWNRGAYLVEGPGHCAECHSPRNPAGGIDRNRRFAGGPDPEGKGYIPNITPHADGLEKWSEKDLTYLLETGFTPAYDSVGSSMADVVMNTSKLTAQDRAAMAMYLKSLPPRPGKKAAKN